MVLVDRIVSAVYTRVRRVPQPLPPREDREKGADDRDPGRGLSPEDDHTGSPTLDFPAPRTVRSQLLR